MNKEYCKFIERIAFEQVKNLSIDSERLNTIDKQYSGEVMII